MSKVILEFDEEGEVWFHKVREGITVGLNSVLHSHTCQPDGINSVVTNFCDGKIFTILQKHISAEFVWDETSAPTDALHKVVTATDKAGFCVDLALAAFEEGLKFHQDNHLSHDDMDTD